MSIISNKLKLVLGILLISCLPAMAQQQLYINTVFSTTGLSTTANANNGNADTFILQYYTTGGPGAVNITIEGDPGTGSFATCGAASTVTTAAQIRCSGQYKQVQIHLVTLTGGTAPTVVATLVGSSSALVAPPVGVNSTQVQGSAAAGATASTINPVLISCDSSTSGNVTATQQQNVRCRTDGGIIVGTGALGLADGNGNAVNTPATIANAQIVYEVAPILFNGTTWDRQIYCNNRAKLNALGAATTQIVALSGATKIRVCNATISNNNATATTLKFVEGTGANCGTGTADVSALMNIGATTTTPFFLNYGSTSPLVIATGGDALCLTSSAASSLEITIMYEQH